MLARLANGLFAVAGAGTLAQFPAFYRQYLQHLSGRLAQARANIAPVADDAQQRGLTISEYLTRAAQEGGELTGKLVEGYRSTYQTLQQLETAYAALRSAGPLERPLAFARHFDSVIVQTTAVDFAPGLPLTPEGGGYALVGLLVGTSLLWTLERPAVAVAKRRRRRRAQRQASEHTPSVLRDRPEQQESNRS